MSVRRSENWLGQARIDVPHLRSTESASNADWDAFAGNIMAGSQALVVRGFTLIDSLSSIGQPAASLRLDPSNGALNHPLASESGSVFFVTEGASPEILDPTLNPRRIEGSFTSNSTNYIGIDLRRSVDNSTIDTVMFLDPVIKQETPKSVALARTLDYKIVISTTDFSQTPTICPVAIVVTDSSTAVSSVTDARQLWFRLGSGGSNPDTANNYSWPQGRAIEVVNTFTGGDKAVGSDKEWRDAIMTRLWELGGGERWFSATSDRDVKITYGPNTLSNGFNFRWTLGSQTLEWKDLDVVFGNSSVHTNSIVDGSAVLADGDCLYVDLNREAIVALTPVVGTLETLGSPVVPGARFILAWRLGNTVFARDLAFEVGRVIPVATNTTTGIVQLSFANPISDPPLVAPMSANNSLVITASGGNAASIVGTGNGSGNGIVGIPGSLGGNFGLFGDGASGAGANNSGVKGNGKGTGVGVDGFATSNVSSAGVRGHGATLSPGLVGLGSGSSQSDITSAGQGVLGIAATGGGNGGEFLGKGVGSGLKGTGGATDGIGVEGVGTGTGAGLKGTGGAGVAGSNAIIAVAAATNTSTGLYSIAANHATPGAAIFADVYGVTSPSPGKPGVGLLVRHGDTLASTSNTGSQASILLGLGSALGLDGISIFAEKVNDDQIDLHLGKFINNGTTASFIKYDTNRDNLVFFNDTADSASQAVHKSLNSRNLPKAWALCKVTRTGPSAFSPTVLDSFNTLAAGSDPSFGVESFSGVKYLRVGWSQDFLNANYTVNVTIGHDNASDMNFSVLVCGPSWSTPGPPQVAGKVYLLPIDTTTGNIFDIDTLILNHPIYLHIAATGRQ